MTKKTPPSRMEREVEEILAKAKPLPVNLNDRRRQKQRTARVETVNATISRSGGSWRFKLRLLPPLVVAFLLGVLALMVGGWSPLLAQIAGLGAVAMLWLPGVLALSRPGGGPSGWKRPEWRSGMERTRNRQ